MNRKTVLSTNRVIRVIRRLQEPLPALLFPGGSPQQYESRDLLHVVRVEVDADELMRALESKAAVAKRGYTQICSGAIRVYAKEVKA